MKETKYLLKMLLVAILVALVCSCKDLKSIKNSDSIEKEQNEKAFTIVILKHLKAVSDKNLEALKATLSPKGNMELIQPGMEIIYSVDGFLTFHKDFFSSPTSRLNFSIISENIGYRMGVVTTEALYEEPIRNGKPYFNRLTVTYTLEKINHKWYVIKDHASSIEKTIY